MHLGLLEPALVLGVVQAGLYGLLPIPLVLCYRVSRTIAFIHGGIAAAAALLYWFLTYDEALVPGYHPGWSPLAGLLFLIAAGASVGAGWGAVVASTRLVGRARMTHTVMSLAAMLLLFGIVTITVRPAGGFVNPRSPFGTGSVEFGGVVLTRLRLVTLAITGVLVVGLAVLLARTRAGRHIRAIADDLQAAQWCGVDVTRIGTGVQAASGAIAALAGILIASTVGADPAALLDFLLRALTVAVIGGMTSLPVALAGAVAISVVETVLTAGVFGTVPLGVQELCLDAVLVIGVLSVTRLRGTEFYLLSRQSL